MAKFYDLTDGEENAREVTDPGEIAALRQSGNLAVDSSGPVVVTDAQGSNRRVVEGNNVGADIATLLDQGFQFETDAVTARQSLVQDAQSSPFRAGGEALLRGATLGLSDVAADALGANTEAMQARQEALGHVGTGLEIAGGLIPGLASGGTSLGARALASTPAGLLARGAASAGARAEAALLARGVGQGAARIAGMAAEGALDGAVANVGAALSEASLGDLELTAEELVSAGGLGALLGFAGGGVLGGASNKASSKIRQIAAKYDVAEPGTLADEIAPGIAPRRVAETIEAGAEDAGGYRHLADWAKSKVAARTEDPEFIREVMNNASMKHDILNRSAVESELNTKIRSGLDESINYDHLMRDLGAGGQKVENLRRTIRTDTGEQALGEARQRILAPWRAKLDDLRNRDLMTKAEYNDLVKEIDYVDQTIGKGFTGETGGGAFSRKTGTPLKAQTDAAEAYYALDRFKASLSNEVKLAHRGKSGGSSTPEMRKAAEVQATALQVRNDLQQYLEREDLFGAPAAQQRERNMLWSKAINSGKMFNKQLTDMTGRGLPDDADNWFEMERYTQGDKVQSFLKKLTDPKDTVEVDLTRQHIQDKRDLYRYVRETGQVPDEQVASFERAEAGFQRALDALDEGKVRLGNIGKFETMHQLEKEATGFGAHLPMLGALVGGAPGAALGSLAGAVAQPVGMVRKAMQLEAMANHVRGRKAATVSRVQGAVNALAQRSVRRPGTASPGRLALRVANRASVRLFGPDRVSARKKAREAETRIVQLARSPQRMADALTYQAKDLVQAAPKTATLVAMQSQKAIDFLNSKLPPVTAAVNKLQPHLTQRMWTDANVDSFQRYMAAAMDPDSVIDDLEAGKLTTEGVETLKALYPRKFQEMQIAATEVLAKHQDEMPHSAALQLCLLLDIDGIPTLTPQFQQTFQGILQKQAQQAQQTAPPQQPPSQVSQLAKSSQSLSDRLSQGLESP